ncbi:MAG TPA: CHAT domain-containing tetratricopeptide repeat protein [Steroidobacteraceae bacterium]|nr:CHAT domain-containing tetratricopeptide repeat protein [Steroidobacteraceae bacterium]
MEEHDNDVRVEILDSRNQVLTQAEHPERRTGTRRLAITAPDSGSVTVRITGQEHVNAAGTATVRAFDLAALRESPRCLEVFRALAAGDAAYAAGREISRGRSALPGQSAREAYLEAAESYASAERALTQPADALLHAQTELALAGVEYFGLQNWSKAAEWGQRATAAFGNADPYRRARAQWITDLAWMEVGSSVGRDRPVPGQSISSTELLNRTRRSLEALGRFHLQRHESYDAAMALTNVQLVYQLQARFNECVAASETPARLFDELHETVRRATVWQNQALCLWGLGRLPEALVWFERALADIGPGSPSMYVAVVTNTALLDYALGHFDESLQLYDRALTLAEKTQSRRDEAYSLYGVGVNYSALGDEDRAREFLERSLVIRTVALDGRGRMVTLRELATVQAAQGKFADALKSDREALTLAVAPSSIMLIKIQLAVHTADAGQLADAKAQLDELLAGDARAYPLIRAEALLQRAVMERKLDQPRAALADLRAAQPQLHRYGSVTEEFEADLELARTLRLMGQPEAALRAVERALRDSDAVRLQTVNPELRSMVQTPLREAYDLKIELFRARYEDALTAGRKAAADALAADAFIAADAARAHSFSDVAAQEYSPAMRHDLAPEFRRREALYRELAARRYALADRLQRASPDDPRARHLMSDIAELERQADTVNTTIAARTVPEATPPSTATRRLGLPRLPPDTALISYWLGAESAYVWVVAPDGIRWVRLSSPETIATQAIAFHHSLSRIVDVPTERRLKEAGELYESILRPIDAALEHVREWVVIPDGALDYVPFAALRDVDAHPATFVVLRHDVVLTPAAWRLDTGRVPPGAQHPRGLLLVADPVYQPDDPRLVSVARTNATPHAAANRGGESPARALLRLPYTAEEAAGIAAEFPRGEVEALTGVEATRDRLLALDWSKYRYIHIAAHGIVDAQVPQLSALILGSYDASGNVVDGAVRVADLSLRRLRADVAVFSACDTALGREVPSEGLVGISSTVLARGAHAVVASLWPVSDEIGARLMTEFYRHLLHDSMSPAAALGAAMRSVVSRDQSADPALWAAFQISVSTLRPGLPASHIATTRVPTPGREESP